MIGHMQHHQMNLINILAFAARNHGSTAVVSRISKESCHQYSYAEAYQRTAQLAHALHQLDVQQGTVVATLAWNHYRHFESWYAIAGLGAVCHTVNPRLYPEQISYIINQGGAEVLLVDPVFANLIVPLLSEMPKVRQLIWNCSEAEQPSLKIDVNSCSYEALIATQPTNYDWPELAEDAASSLCFTSGTTGHPKGVLYSHRSNMLMAMSTKAADGLNIHSGSTVLMVVPMFHANSWGIVYSAPMAGATLVLPGPFLDGASIHQLLIEYQVTMSAAVPTVWSMLLEYLQKNQLNCGVLKEVVIGGAAVPRTMVESFSRDYGVEVVHAWGMTEISPVGTVNRPCPALQQLPEEERLNYALKQGRPLYGIELQLRNDDEQVLCNDGKTPGRLMVRGDWVVARYLAAAEPCVDNEGWFDTGDIATIDQLGYMQITDRSKDIIKSGGEWISSVELENTCLGYPSIAQAAVIAKPDPKWSERPLLLVRLKEGYKETPLLIPGILEFLAQRVSRWWLPDEIRVVTQIPLTATGKIDKKQLRQQHLS